jgi:hypothetical protein
MFEGVDKAFKEIQKKLQKTIIRTATASQHITISENAKLITKQMETVAFDEIQEASSSYIGKFTVAAKGHWVKTAQQSFKETSKGFSQS